MENIDSYIEDAVVCSSRTFVYGDFNARVGKSDGEQHWLGILGPNAEFVPRPQIYDMQ